MSFNLGSAHGEIVIDYNGAGVQQAMGDLNSLSQQGTNLLRAGAGVTAFGGVLGGMLLGATNQAADFQFQMDAVNAALGGLDASGMEAVTQQALDLGAATKFSAGEVAGVQENLAKMGLTADQITANGEGATKAVLDLASATGEQLAPAATAVGAALNLFGLDATQTADVADILTAALNGSSATLPDMQRGINNLGPVMSNLAQYTGDAEGALRDTAATVAYFNSQGLKAADAGVSIARGLTNLANPTSKATAEMNALGISAFDAQGNFKPLPEIMDNLRDAMSGMSDQQREAALATIFGAEAADVMNIAIKKGGDPLREQIANTEAAGQAAEQAAIRQNNLRGALENLGGSVQTAAIALGTPFLGPLQAAAQAITNLVNLFIGLPPEVQGAIAAFLALSSALLLVGGGAITVAGAILRFGPAFAAAAAAAAPFLAIMLAIGAAIGLGILAYKTDFLGFGTAVNKAFSTAQKAIKNFGAGFNAAFFRGQQAGLNDAANAVQAFGDALLFATGIDITGFTDRAAAAIQQFGNTWAYLTDRGVMPAVAGLFAFADALDALGLSGLSQQVDNLAQSTANFGAEFAASGAQAREAGFSDLAANIIAFGDALDYVTGLPVEPFFRAVVGAVQVFGTSFATARADGIDPLTSALIALRDALTQLTGINLAPVFDQLGESIQSAADGVQTFVQTLQAGDIGGALSQLGTAISDALTGLAVTLTDWVLNVAAPAVMTFIGNASDWILEQLNNAGTIIDNFTAWVLNVGLPAAGEIMGSIAAWLSEKLTGLAITISSFTQWVLDVGLPAAGEFVGDLGAWISDKLEGAAIAISDFTGWSLSLGLPSGGGNNAQAGLGGTGVSGADFTGFITDALTAAAIAIENFTGWSLTITTPEGGVQVDGAAIEAAIRSALTVDISAVDIARDIGGDLGTQAGNAFWQGFVDLFNQFIGGFGDGGGGAPTAAGMASGVGFGAGMGASIGDAVLAFFAAFKDQFMAAIDAGIDQTVADINAALEAKKAEFFSGIMDALRGLFDFVTGTQEAQAAPGEGIDAAQIGTDMGKQFGEVFQSQEFLDSFNTALDAIPTETFASIGTGLMTKISAAINTALQTPTGMGEAQPSGPAAGGAFAATIISNLATGLQTAIDSAPLETFAAIGTSLITKIQGAITAAMTTATAGGGGAPVGEGAVGGLGAQLVQSLATSIASSITEAPIEAFATIGTALQTKISEVLATAMQAGGGQATPQAGLGGTGGGGGIGQAIAQSIASAITGADFATVATALQTQLTTVITTAITQTGTVIATGLAQWVAEFTNGFVNITTVVTNGMTTVSTAITTGMTAVTTAITSGMAAAQTAVSTAIAAITAQFTAFATAATTAGQTAGTGFSTGLTTGLAAAQAAAQAAVDAIIGILNSAADGAYAAGAAVGEGFAAGMEASLGRVQAAAAAMADAAAEGLAAAAQIASPSKVSMALGEQFGQGFQLGIAGAAPNAAKSSYDMGFESIHALADSLRSNADARVSRLRSLGDHIRENQGLASGGGQPMTIETTGTVEMDGEQMGTFTVETVLGGLIGAQRKGGKRRGRMQ